jgi:hypothetical protein
MFSVLRRSTKDVRKKATFLSSHNTQLSGYSITTDRRYTKRKATQLIHISLKGSRVLARQFTCQKNTQQKAAAKNIKRIKAM